MLETALTIYLIAVSISTLFCVVALGAFYYYLLKKGGN
jgi:hypothetical protein